MNEIKNQPKNYITTYKKHRFSPVNPDPKDIDTEDIAHALSLMCRANGHFTRFFSVARHCINCCREGEARGLNKRICLMLLLHDACEAYISDITRPVKLNLPDYIKIEEHLQNIIQKKYNITPTEEETGIIAEIDDMMLKLEFLEFAGENILIETVLPVIPPDFGYKTYEEDEKEFLELIEILNIDNI